MLNQSNQLLSKPANTEQTVSDCKLFHTEPLNVTHNTLQVLFNGVSMLTLLLDAHMRVSAIRFYLLSLVVSGTHHSVIHLKVSK